MTKMICLTFIAILYICSSQEKPPIFPNQYEMAFN